MSFLSIFPTRKKIIKTNKKEFIFRQQEKGNIDSNDIKFDQYSTMHCNATTDFNWYSTTLFSYFIHLAARGQLLHAEGEPQLELNGTKKTYEIFSNKLSANLNLLSSPTRNQSVAVF